MKVTLYKVTATGSIQQWSIDKVSNDTISIVWGKRGGLMQKQTELVEVNQSGRTLEQQVQSRIDSRINSQLDKGYCSTIEEAQKSIGLDANKFYKPMLALVYEPTKPYNFREMFWQYKYNGHRCLITRVGDEIFAYSRNGKPISTIGHITNNLDIPEGCTLDGELYIHRAPLQTISSIVRRKQPDNVKLNYIVYDVIKDLPFGQRLDFLAKLNMPNAVIMAPAFEAPKPEMLTNAGIKNEAQAKGFEGFMLRTDNRFYEPGKRSSQLLKVKARLDMEVKVLDVEASADGWAVLVCSFRKKNNTIGMVKVVAPGTMAQKREILQNKEDYIGKLLTIEFAEFTKDGIPFHPVAITFREKE